jgi:hypothetical protein
LRFNSIAFPLQIAATRSAHVGQEFLSLGDGSTKHRIFIHYSGWSSDRWDSWVDARCRSDRCM